MPGQLKQDISLEIENARKCKHVLAGGACELCGAVYHYPGETYAYWDGERYIEAVRPETPKWSIHGVSL